MMNKRDKKIQELTRRYASIKTARWKAMSEHLVINPLTCGNPNPLPLADETPTESVIKRGKEEFSCNES